MDVGVAKDGSPKVCSGVEFIKTWEGQDLIDT